MKYTEHIGYSEDFKILGGVGNVDTEEIDNLEAMENLENSENLKNSQNSGN